MFWNFKVLEANMGIKLHYLHSHLDEFPDNLDVHSEETEKSFTKILGQWKKDT